MNFLYNWFRFGYIKTKRYLRKTKRWNDENATILESKQYPMIIYEPGGLQTSNTIFTSPNVNIKEVDLSVIEEMAKNGPKLTKRKVSNRRKSKPDRSRKRNTKKSKSPR
ncbi:MAG TPA: hypothetical protein VEP90_14530 [Methylomirabilota bacterium]|nr:hypothetical protein [Methylomirabilota bacterium]